MQRTHCMPASHRVRLRPALGWDLGLHVWHCPGVLGSSLRQAPIPPDRMLGPLSTHWDALVQVQKALSWLGAGRGAQHGAASAQHRPLAAALMLKELAVAMPAVFNMHVRTFIACIWTGIRHPALAVRHASVDALRVRSA